MHPLSDAQLAEAAAIIGKPGATTEATGTSISPLLGEPLPARRVTAWLPETFALALIPYLAPVKLPTTFSTRTEDA